METEGKSLSYLGKMPNNQDATSQSQKTSTSQALHTVRTLLTHVLQRNSKKKDNSIENTAEFFSSDCN